MSLSLSLSAEPGAENQPEADVIEIDDEDSVVLHSTYNLSDVCKYPDMIMSHDYFADMPPEISCSRGWV